MEENSGFWRSNKVAKTGNIGKRSAVAGDIDYVRYLSMQKVKRENIHQTPINVKIFIKVTEQKWNKIQISHENKLSDILDSSIISQCIITLI